MHLLLLFIFVGNGDDHILRGPPREFLKAGVHDVVKFLVRGYYLRTCSLLVFRESRSLPPATAKVRRLFSRRLDLIQERMSSIFLYYFCLQTLGGDTDTSMDMRDSLRDSLRDQLRDSYISQVLMGNSVVHVLSAKLFDTHLPVRWRCVQSNCLIRSLKKN